MRPEVDVVHEHDHSHDGSHAHDHPPARDDVATAEAAVLVGHRHPHSHRGLVGPFGVAGAISVGMVHGVGAETPTQVIALASGTASLAPFLAGLFLANTVAAIVATTALTATRLRVMNALVGVFSVVVGIPYLLGSELPLW